MIIIFLTCANNQEADKISDTLLDKHLIVCIKKLSVSSKYLWKGKKEKAEEILLIMESEENMFDEIEKNVKSLHSYEMPVLTGIPVIKSSKGILNWFSEELK